MMTDTEIATAVETMAETVIVIVTAVREHGIVGMTTDGKMMTIDGEKIESFVVPKIVTTVNVDVRWKPAG